MREFLILKRLKIRIVLLKVKNKTKESFKRRKYSFKEENRKSRKGLIT
jgi:hypothetical protein